MRNRGLPSTVLVGRGLEKFLAPPPLNLMLSASSAIRCASRSQPGQRAPVIQHATFFCCGKSEPPGIWHCAFFFPRYFCL